MKRIKYRYLIPGSVILLFVLYACGKNFLNKPPIGALSPQLLASSERLPVGDTTAGGLMLPQGLSIVKLSPDDRERVNHA